MRLGISMDVGIFEKSRRLRIARISLDMLSPENLPSRPPEFDCLHLMAVITREGRAGYGPPVLVLIAQLLRSPEPAALDCSEPRAQNVLPSCLSRHSQNLKLLLSAAVRTCYKNGGQGYERPPNGPKAL